MRTINYTAVAAALTIVEVETRRENWNAVSDALYDLWKLTNENSYYTNYLAANKKAMVDRDLQRRGIDFKNVRRIQRTTKPSPRAQAKRKS